MTTRLDLRYALRSLRRTPAFALAAVTIVALSIAAAAVVFALVNAVYLRALPYPNASRTVIVRQADQTAACRAGCPLLLPAEALRAMARELAADAEVGLGHDTEADVGMNSATILTDGIAVSPEFVRVLGMRPAVGRVIVPADTLVESEPSVLLSHAFWRDQFGGDSSIVGRVITIDGHPHRVIGVLRPNDGIGKPFFSPSEAVAPFVVPMSSPAATVGEEAGFALVARLKANVTLEQFRARARIAFARARADQMPRGGNAPAPRVDVLFIRDAFDQTFVSVYPTFLAAVLLAIGVAAANLAALFLSRQVYRARETVVRAALGASKRDLCRPIWLESVIVCVAGGVVGIVAARWLLAAVVLLPIKVVPYWTTFQVDARVIAFAAFVSFTIALIVGLVPSAIAGRSMGENLRAAGGDRSQHRLATHSRRLLVAFQVASAVVLLSCGGLLVRTFWTATHVDTGVASRSLLFGAIEVSASTATSARSQPPTLAANEVLAQLRSTDGVRLAAVAASARGVAHVLTMRRPDGSVEVPAGAMNVNMISSGYFSTLSTPVIAGRDLNVADQTSGSDVAVVDEQTARALFGTTSVVGQLLKLGPASSPEPWRRIVGVVRSQRLAVVAALPEGRRTVFVPLASSSPSTLRFIVRASGPSQIVRRNIERTLHELAPESPVAAMRSIEQLIGAQLEPLKLNALVVGVFASVGLLLSAIGVYGIVAFGIAQRRTDIAVRIALGAQRWDVVRMLVHEAMWLGGIGVVVGVISTIAVTRLISSFLYGTNPLDPPTIGAAVVSTFGFAVAGALISAVGASRISPVDSLRV